MHVCAFSRFREKIEILRYCNYDDSFRHHTEFVIEKLIYDLITGNLLILSAKMMRAN